MGAEPPEAGHHAQNRIGHEDLDQADLDAGHVVDQHQGRAVVTERLEHSVDDPDRAEDDHPAVGPDDGRGQQRGDRHRHQQALEPAVRAGQEERNGIRQHRAEDRNLQAHQEGVEDDLPVIRV
ncbi:hypothetical protein SDC9_105345 [bioreactor metagenome]|uniref:Uncharacterized protein n=1 Tax=bioreactor metagenome TaxID=1076179 RepID=A0A645BA12_9ZZZZ